MKVNRKELLQKLTMLSGGLSNAGVVEQSSCFVFQGKQVYTYNEDVAAFTDSPLDIEGAVDAPPLLALLKKMSEDEIEVTPSDGELVIKGKNRRAGIRFDDRVLLSLDEIDDGDEWMPIPDGFMEAVKTVKQCCSVDSSSFVFTCVHICPTFMESSDNYQIIRYTIKTGLSQPCMIRRTVLDALDGVAMTEMQQTENWLHFRNAEGLRISCRQQLIDERNKYPIKDIHYHCDGGEIEFPDGMRKAVEKVQIFCDSDVGIPVMQVKLGDSKIWLKGSGPKGHYTEVNKLQCKYEGEPISFQIAPRLFLEILGKSRKCVIGKGRIRVQQDKWVYVSCTGGSE